MTTSINYVFTLAQTLLLPSVSFSQTIDFGKNSPSAGLGSISGTGSYDCGVGSSVYQIKFNVIGPLGNNPNIYQQIIIPNPANQKGIWNGQIQNLPPGQYNITVQLYYTDAFGNVKKLNPLSANNNPLTVMNPPE